MRLQENYKKLFYTDEAIQKHLSKLENSYLSIDCSKERAKLKELIDKVKAAYINCCGSIIFMEVRGATPQTTEALLANATPFLHLEEKYLELALPILRLSSLDLPVRKKPGLCGGTSS